MLGTSCTLMWVKEHSVVERNEDADYETVWVGQGVYLPRVAVFSVSQVYKDREPCGLNFEKSFCRGEPAQAVMYLH